MKIADKDEFEKQTAQCHTATLASREVLHRLVFGRTAQRIHGAFQLAFQW